VPSFPVVAWRVGFICPECMGPVPLNAIAPRVQCAHCQSSIDTAKQLEWLSKVFGFWGPPNSWKRGELQKNNAVSGMHSEGDLRVAVCRSCQAPLDSDDVGAAIVASSTGVACRGCGESTAVRVADDTVKAILSATRIVLGEASTDAGAPAPVQPVLFACLQCGGGLTVDGSKRIVTCGYCQSSNFISDALWLRMHPAQKRQWIYFCHETFIHGDEVDLATSVR
jgi:DNA-directed RNA polymerase subunit RPC12/RpoP